MCEPRYFTDHLRIFPWHHEEKSGKRVQNCTKIVQIITCVNLPFLWHYSRSINTGKHAEKVHKVHKVWNYWGVSECCSGVLSSAMSVSVAGVSASDWSPASPSWPLIGHKEDTNHCQVSAEMRRPRLVTRSSSDETMAKWWPLTSVCQCLLSPVSVW